MAAGTARQGEAVGAAVSLGSPRMLGGGLTARPVTGDGDGLGGALGEGDGLGLADAVDWPAPSRPSGRR